MEGSIIRAASLALLLCVTLLQGAHAAYYSFSSIYWKDAGYSPATIGYLWSLGVVAEILVFAFSHILFRRWTARSLLLLSAVSGIIRWSLMASTTELPWLILSKFYIVVRLLSAIWPRCVSFRPAVGRM